MATDGGSPAVLGFLRLVGACRSTGPAGGSGPGRDHSNVGRIRDRLLCPACPCRTSAALVRAASVGPRNSRAADPAAAAADPALDVAGDLSTGGGKDTARTRCR